MPWLFDFYESFASTEAFSETPLEPLFSLALPFWISVFTCIFSLVHRQRKAAGISLLLILITATFLLGPVCCGRYILYNIFEIPLLLACLCGILDREESKSEVITRQQPILGLFNEYNGSDPIFRNKPN